MPPSRSDSGRNATLVAAGILLSRLMGLVRQKLFAHYLGSSAAAAAFSAAMRIPNVLQNLLGEGVLSASFIPVYAGLRSQRQEAEASQVASAVFGLLTLLTSVMVAVGMLASPLLVDAIAPGYEGATRELTVRLVRILFPGTGVLVLSAWCLGVLNSHRRFFLSYAAPVLWNGCIIAAMVAFAGRVDADQLAVIAAYGVVAGGFVQFGVQVPTTLRLLQRFAPTVSVASAAVRQVLRSFLPAVGARGVVQISAWLDTAYASLITERAVAVLSYAQTISLLPVSLFGMAISAAELPAMSEDAAGATDERHAALRARLTASLERVLFFIAPSAVAFAALGDVVAAVLLQSGRFTPADSRFAWYILLGAAVGLTAQTRGRLYSSAFFALKDTRTPLKFAVVRVTVGAVFGYVAVRILPGRLGLPAELGAVGVTLTTGVSAWLEFTLLRAALRRRIGPGTSTLAPQVRIWGAALVAGAAGLGVKLLAVQRFGAVAVNEWGGDLLPPPAVAPLLFAPVCLGVFGVVYFAITGALGVPQATAVLRRLRRRSTATQSQSRSNAAPPGNR